MDKNIGNLIAHFGADTKDFERGVASVESSLKGLKGAVGGLFALEAVQMAGEAINKLKDVTADLVKSYAEAQTASATLNAALQATGRAADGMNEKLVKNAEALSYLTTAEDDAIIKATARFTQYARSLSGPEIQQAQTALVALADKMGGDLDRAGIMLARGLEGNARALQRFGVVVDKNADSHERLKQVLEQTQSAFEVAKSKTETLQGQFTQLDNEVGNVKETLGEIIVTGLEFGDTTKSMIEATRDFNKALQDNAQFIIKTIATVKMVATNLFGVFSGTISAMVNGVGGAIIGIASFVLGQVNRMAQGVVNIVNLVPQQLNRIPGVNIPLTDTGFLGTASTFTNILSGNMLGTAGKSLQDLGKLKSFSDLARLWDSSNVIAPISIGGGINASVMGDLPGSGKTKKGKKGKEVKPLGQAEGEFFGNIDSLIPKFDDYLKKIESFGSTFGDVMAKAGDHMLEFKALNEQFLPLQEQVNQKMEQYSYLLNMGAEGQRLYNDLKTKEIEALGMEDPLKSEHLKQLEDEKRKLDVLHDIKQRVLDVENNYKDTMEALNKLHDAGAISASVFAGQMKANEDAYVSATNALKGIKDTGDDTMQQLIQVTQRFGQQFKSTIQDAITTGKFNLLDFANSFAAMIAEMLIQLTIINPLVKGVSEAINNSFSGGLSAKIGTSLGNTTYGLLGGGKSGGSFAGNIGASLAGTRAMGGPVLAGASYLVGENGPEIFSPANSGYVTPNGAMAGRATNINQTFTIVSPDTGGFRQLLAQEQPFIQRMAVAGVNQAYNRRGMKGPMG